MGDGRPRTGTLPRAMSTPSQSADGAPVHGLTDDVLRRAPKVLLHEHLDGCLRPATVLELAHAASHQQEQPGERERDAE